MRLLNGQAPSELTAILGVLGRPRTELDELPQSTFEPIGYSGVWIDSVRLIAVTGMHELRVFLIPGVMRDPRRAKASRDARSRPGVPLVALDVYQSSGRVGPCAYTAGDLLAGRVVRAHPPAGTDEERLMYGVVPDGVSSVQVKAGDMPERTAKVKDNFFEARMFTGGVFSEKVSTVTTEIRWIDESGQTLKTITRTERWVMLGQARLDLQFD